MSYYLIKLTPIEPYFFGGEKNFILDENLYYIKSQTMMSQNTAFGSLRYLGIRNLNDNYILDEESIKQIGEKSFSFFDNNEFGKIKRISEVFISCENKLYIPLPMDYYRYIGNGFDKKEYNPYRYVNVEDFDDIVDDVFSTTKRLGIKKESKKEEDKELFKKDYAIMKDGYSFAYYCEVEDDFVFSKSSYVYLGTGKSLFVVNINKKEDNEIINYKKIMENYNENSYLCVSDIFLSNDGYSKLDAISSDNLIKNKQYRSFTTCYEANAKGRNRLIKGAGVNLIEAGSVINNCNEDELKKLINSENEAHAKIAGFNQIINNKGERL